jgi:hypothetical protein
MLGLKVEEEERPLPQQLFKKLTLGLGNKNFLKLVIKLPKID